METNHAVAMISSRTAALDEVYRLHAGKAKALAYILSGDMGVAEDLVQDAFVRLAGRFNHLRSHEALEAYLRRTVVNLHVSRLRRVRRDRLLASRQAAAAAGVAVSPDLGALEEILTAL
jgi:DNA-directed RNA polymerase specialized sigma24 family protein